VDEPLYFLFTTTRWNKIYKFSKIINFSLIGAYTTTSGVYLHFSLDCYFI
jgi:hypothetical protein